MNESEILTIVKAFRLIEFGVFKRTLMVTVQLTTMHGFVIKQDIKDTFLVW